MMDNTLYLSEFHLGDKFTTVNHTITEAAVVMFAGITGDFHPLHTDEEYVKTTPYGCRIAHGMLTAAVAVALWTRVGVIERSAIGQINSTWKFMSPVKFGDTIHVEAQVLEIKRSRSKPDRGVLSYQLTVLNQRGETVAVNQTDSMLKWEEECS